jgi:LysM repeat protein
VPPRRRRFYRLQLGETLSDVAIKFHTSVERLLALNPGIRPTNLNVGQRLRVK